MWVQYFWYEGWFWYGCQPCLSSESADHYPLDGTCGWCCGVQSLSWMLGRVSSLLHGCYSPIRGEVCSPVAGVCALRVWIDVSIALECMLCTKGSNCWSNWGPCVHSISMHCSLRHLQFYPWAAHSHVLFSVVFFQDLTLDCGAEWAGGRYNCDVAAGIEVVVLSPGTWAVPVADLSQDLSTPDPASSCGMDWAEPEGSHWEMNHCILLPSGCPPKTYISVAPPCCVPQQSPPQLDPPLPCMLKIGSEVQPRPTRLCQCSYTESSSRSCSLEIQHLPTSHTSSPTQCVLGTGKCSEAVAASGGLSPPWFLTSQNMCTPLEQSPGPSSPSIHPSRPPSMQSCSPVWTFPSSLIPPRCADPILRPFLNLVFCDNCFTYRCIFLCVCEGRGAPHPATPPSSSSSLFFFYFKG